MPLLEVALLSRNSSTAGTTQQMQTARKASMLIGKEGGGGAGGGGGGGLAKARRGFPPQAREREASRSSRKPREEAEGRAMSAPRGIFVIKLDYSVTYGFIWLYTFHFVSYLDEWSSVIFVLYVLAVSF